jgi:hypothetical protein
MTRTVAEKAMQLLTESVSNIAGKERLIADALVSASRFSPAPSSLTFRS